MLKRHKHLAHRAPSSAVATRTLAALTLLAGSAPLSALAQSPEGNTTSTEQTMEVASARAAPALEVNVMWPFFPGGMVDLKLIVPALRAKERDWRGESIVGLHSDFGWRFVRAPDAGRVALMAVKLGYRQFLVHGLHIESTVNAGWRHEEDNPWDGEVIDSFQGRLWNMVGYQHEFSPRVYGNVRAGLGVHLWRTDRFASRERLFAPGGDINIGVRF